MVAHVFFNVAVVVRVVGGVWSQLPADLVAAARVLGAGPWRATREVTLPLLRPALVAAGSIAFLFTFTSFGVVQILGGPTRVTIEVEIARRATQLGDVGGAAVLSLLQLALLAIVVGITVRTQRRASVSIGLHAQPSPRPRTPRTRLAVGAGAVTVAALVVAPLAALAVSSVRPGGSWSLTAWRTFGDGPVRPGADLAIDAIGAIAASLRAAALATVLAVVIGTLAALAISSARRGGRLLDVGSMLPLGTSAVTIGFGMLITFDRAPVDWRGEPWLVAVGHALVAVPFVVRAILPVLRARPVGLARGGGDARRLTAARLVGDRRPSAASPRARRRVLRRRGVARRVRCDDVPEPHGPRDPAGGDRPSARPRRRRAPGAGVGVGGGAGGRHDRRARGRRTARSPDRRRR